MGLAALASPEGGQEPSQPWTQLYHSAHGESVGAVFVHRDDMGATFMPREGVGAAFVLRDNKGLCLGTRRI